MRRRHADGSVESVEGRTPGAARFGYSSTPAAGLVRAARCDRGSPGPFGRTAESVVTYWPGGIRAGVEVALAPCPGIRVR